ncbi:MAG: efflux RND transporter periplasmic adaptor subunit [Pseudomonadota bacterium]
MAVKKSYAIAGVLAIGLVGWLASGQIGGSDDAGLEAPAVASVESTTDEHASPTMSVRVRELTAEPIEREIVINGKTAPVRHVQLRAETMGRVLDIDVEDGTLVDRNDVLVRLDPRDRELVKLEAEALLRQRRIELDAARKLNEKGFQAETNVALAEASFATAEAALKRATMALEHIVIKAPFAGVLDRRHVEIGDFVDVGDPIATILDQDPFLLIGDVTETEVGKVQTGMATTARLASGEHVAGVVTYVASQANEETRTFDIEIEVPNPSGRLTAGASAEIRLSLERVAAHRLSPSVLTLADDGTLGVKTVDANDVVVFMPVEIAKADDNHVWLTGLPETVRLITVGQGFVSDGVEVIPALIDDDGNADSTGQVVSEVTQ